ncbi:unnamed protein product [Amoebophrya sp. A25]|nr:unnamed protein product [Amoebophrya sp. A25]|eukprot:GSA25T00007689001.1
MNTALLLVRRKRCCTLMMYEVEAITVKIVNCMQLAKRKSSRRLHLQLHYVEKMEVILLEMCCFFPQVVFSASQRKQKHANASCCQNILISSSCNFNLLQIRRGPDAARR